MGNLPTPEEKKLDNLFEKISNIINNGRNEIVEVVYNSMTKSYYLIGQSIVENEQSGNIRAEYGKQILQNLSARLIQKYGRGYSVRNLREIRTFYLEIQKRQTTSAELKFPLSFSIYQIILGLEDPHQTFYEQLAIKEKLTVEELKESIKKLTYERYLSGNKQLEFKNKSTNNPKEGYIITNPIKKDPLVLDYLGITKDQIVPESDLEKRILVNLKQFLLDIGRGFAFMGSQKRITISGNHFFVDLEFYHAILNCYVIIDLKKGNFTHQDAGQMQMYVNYYDSEVKKESDNPTIGIILCANKDKNIVEFTLKNQNQIFVTKYLTYLPSKEELMQLVQDQKDLEENSTSSDNNDNINTEI